MRVREEEEEEAINYAKAASLLFPPLSGLSLRKRSFFQTPTPFPYMQERYGNQRAGKFRGGWRRRRQANLQGVVT